ncbi:glycoside hydrolase family 16 protein [Cellulomonas sp. URHD0024]|uniref:glycoside hydrolase family 16 protein n=1 Tax=Cellulomonas sp. URHD0024 TaxID=1302620 RepID=UPI0012DF355D|nr:glycoside hydrolase family 16 protein [Cellulomonas sp. URHD0024]
MRVRRTTVSAMILGTAMLGTALLGASAASAAGTSTCSALFDDFSYTSPNDSALTGNGWQARTNAGGPGVVGAAWSSSNISFPTVDGSKVARLTAYTTGNAGGTSQAELLTGERRFKDGTYASRIRFTDSPTSGKDGDHVNETFFAIGPQQRFDYDPDYSELDFTEYLPNGGWGARGPIAYQTSYNGYRLEPWDPHNAHSQQTSSLNGWHTVVTQVWDGHVKYYMDGALLGDHTVDEQTGQYPVAPRVPMSVNFNLWFIDIAGHKGARSTYTEDVDWFYYAKDQVIAPGEVTATATSLRSSGTTHLDTVDSGLCGGSTTTLVKR